MPKYAKRTDGNQAEIVSHLRSCGIQVIVTNMGDDFPDLLCGSAAGWTLLEVKQPDGCLTRGQLAFISDSRGKVAVVTEKREASTRLWSEDFITAKQRDLIAEWLIRNPDQEKLRVTKFRKIIGEI